MIVSQACRNHRGFCLENLSATECAAGVGAGRRRHTSARPCVYDEQRFRSPLELPSIVLNETATGGTLDSTHHW